MEIQNARTGSRTAFLLVHAIVRRFCAAMTGDTMSSNMSEREEERRERWRRGKRRGERRIVRKKGREKIGKRERRNWERGNGR